MILLTAQPVRQLLQPKYASRAKAFEQKYGRKPKLVVVLVGDDPASVVYTQSKGRFAIECGLDHETAKFPETASADSVRSFVEKLNHDPAVDGILIQQPLPPHFDPQGVLEWIVPSKDVDGFHPQNVGRLHLGLPGPRACTPLGVMRLLEHYRIPVAGKLACVIGRSAIVGKPMAALLLASDATVLQGHSRSVDLRKISCLADLVIAAVGKPGFVRGDWIKPGATVIDVGINRLSDGKLTGDVDVTSVSRVAGALTPVPGGVGPMTIAMLIQNTLDAAENRV